MFSSSVRDAARRDAATARAARGGDRDATRARARRDGDARDAERRPREGSVREIVPGRRRESRIYYGVFQRDARGERERKSDDARRESRDDAAETLTNIDAEERGRRMEVGKAAGAADGGGRGGADWRWGRRASSGCAIAVPLFFALGFAGSAKTGL